MQPFYASSRVDEVDYVATCSVAGVELTPRHVNRGIRAEGLGCLIAICLGGLPCTSYTQNIGIIATTRVASRFVVRVAAVILLLYGLCPKFGALLVALPRPVLGGVFVIVCAMIVASGLGLLARAQPTRSNQTVAGMTLVLAIGLPIYVQFVLGAAWLDTLPRVWRLMVTNPVVLAVIVALTLNLLLNELWSGPDSGR